MLLNCGVEEDSWESLGLQGDPTSPFWRTSVLGVNWKDWCWNWNSNTLATWCKELTHRGQEEKGMTEDEMVGWHPWLNGHGVGQTSAVGDIQAGLACCSSWGRKELDTTEWLNWTELIVKKYNRRKKIYKINPKQLENGNRNIYINNYFKWKWIKSSNQNTQTG